MGALGTGRVHLCRGPDEEQARGPTSQPHHLHQDQSLSARSATRQSFASCVSPLIRFPLTSEAKPHWVDSAVDRGQRAERPPWRDGQPRRDPPHGPASSTAAPGRQPCRRVAWRAARTTRPEVVVLEQERVDVLDAGETCSATCSCGAGSTQCGETPRESVDLGLSHDRAWRRTGARRQSELTKPEGVMCFVRQAPSQWS